MDPQESLNQHRQEISNIDQQILQLLAQRKTHVMAIKHLKEALSLPIKDPNREQELSSIRSKLATEYGLNPQKIDTIFQSILSWSRDLQQGS